MVLFGAVFGWGLLSGGGKETGAGDFPENN
jgi:hypothetical protein